MLFDFFVDGFFLLDIAVNVHLFEAFDEASMHVIFEREHFRARYVHSATFIVETVASLPLDWIVFGVGNIQAGYFLRMLKLVRLVLIFRYAMVLLRHMVGLDRPLVSSPAIEGMMKLVVLFLTVVHILACCWHGIGHANLVNSGHSWLNSKEDLVESSNAMRYLYALYWACYSMTSVGYGL